LVHSAEPDIASGIVGSGDLRQPDSVSAANIITPSARLSGTATFPLGRENQHDRLGSDPTHARLHVHVGGTGSASSGALNWDDVLGFDLGAIRSNPEGR
jgi:hypothetical protein